jgi:hypothetical protein
MKVIIKRPIIFKDPLKDSTVLDYDKFDFTNVNHVRALLLYHNNNTQTDVGCLVFDLNNLIDKLELSEKESIALTKYRDGWTLPMIAQLLYFKKPYSVEALLKQVSKKVVKKYLEMCEDRHYLYVEKGVYKKCTKCGEIKLALNTHFTFQATNILFPQCKICCRNYKRNRVKILSRKNSLN